MAINVQYGPAGGLLDAAVAGGQAQYRQQAAQRDQALLAQVMQYRLGQQQLEQQAQQLQTAYRPVTQPRTTVTQVARPQARITQASPAQAAPTQLPANFGQRTGSGEGSIQVAGREYGFDATGNLIDLDSRDEVRGNFVVPEAGEQQLHPFMEYASQLANRPDVSPAQLAELGAATQMAIQSGMTANQFQNMVGELTQPERPALSPQFVANEQINAVDRDIRTLENEIRDLDKVMTEAGIDPNGPPSQLAPPVRQTGGNFSEFYFGGNVNPNAVDPQAEAAYRRKVQLQGQIAQLEQQRTGILSTGTTDTAASVPVVTSQQAYDSLPAGAQFREEPGGPLFIKE